MLCFEILPFLGEDWHWGTCMQTASIPGRLSTEAILLAASHAVACPSREKELALDIEIVRILLWTCFAKGGATSVFVTLRFYILYYHHLSLAAVGSLTSEART